MTKKAKEYFNGFLEGLKFALDRNKRYNQHFSEIIDNEIKRLTLPDEEEKGKYNAK